MAPIGTQNSGVEWLLQSLKVQGRERSPTRWLWRDLHRILLEYKVIELDPGDIVIAAVQMRDFVLMFTRGGVIYRIGYREAWDGPRIYAERL